MKIILEHSHVQNTPTLVTDKFQWTEVTERVSGKMQSFAALHICLTKEKKNESLHKTDVDSSDTAIISFYHVNDNKIILSEQKRIGSTLNRCITSYEFSFFEHLRIYRPALFEEKVYALFLYGIYIINM